MEPFADQASRDPELKEALINIEAWGLLPRLNRTSVSVFAQNGLLLIELHNKPQLLFFAKELGDIARPGASGAVPIEPVCSLIAKLESDLASERALRLKVAWDCKVLKERIAELERQVKKRFTGNLPLEPRYTKLKKFIALELHPDYFQRHPSEQMSRTELFKVIWSKIEEIDKS